MRKRHKSSKPRQQQHPEHIEIIKRETLKARTEGQQTYIDEMRKSDITICVGPPGSGKTRLPVGLAVEYLLLSKVEKIVVVRSFIGCEESPGALPGGIDQKSRPYMFPLFDELKYFASKGEIVKWTREKIIDVCPLPFIRGRTLKNSFIILDEAQNCTYHQLKTVITRLGVNSKLVINGDLLQSDLKSQFRGGLQSIIDALDNTEGVGICRLGKEDICRHPRLAEIIDRLEQYEKGGHNANTQR